MTTPETDTNSAPKICIRPGCTTPLGPKNKSGKCATHFHWKAPGERTSISGNGHATAASIGDQKAGNGAGNGANGHAIEATHDAPAPKNGSNGARKNAAVLPDLAADRVDQLLATLTAGDKARLALAWLRGEL